MNPSDHATAGAAIPTHPCRRVGAITSRGPGILKLAIALLFACACPNAAVAQPSCSNIGNGLGFGGSLHLFAEFPAGPSSVKWFCFVLPHQVDPCAYLDVFTDVSSPLSGNPTVSPPDTAIALYDVNGNLVASDDNDGPANFSGLTFGCAGDARMYSGNAFSFNGADGATLSPGQYYIAIAVAPATFGPTLWNVTGGPHSTGAGESVDLFMYHSPCVCPSVSGSALGTAPPPTSLGGVPTQPFALDNGEPGYRPGVGENVGNVPAVSGAISFDTLFNHRRVGQNWPAWSNGFMGDVYYSNAATSATITLPAGTRSFVFYVMADFGQPLSLTATADGAAQVVQSGTDAFGYAFHTTDGSDLQSIAIQASRPFAIGQFLASTPLPELHVSTGRNADGAGTWHFDIGQYAGSPGGITSVVATMGAGATINCATWVTCGENPAPVVTPTTATWTFPSGLTPSYPTYSPTCTVQLCLAAASSSPVQITFQAIGPGVATNAVAMMRPIFVSPIGPACVTSVGCDVLYTTNADFDKGTLLSVNHNPSNQLQVSKPGRPLPFLAVACSARGTVVRIDVDSGTIVGEYLTSPTGLNRDPSRSTVDIYGNIYVGNRAEGSAVNPGSIMKVGLCMGGTRGNRTGPTGNYVFTPNPNGQYVKCPTYCTGVDRDGDGLIKTSFGLANILLWPNVTDGVGGGILSGVAQGGSAVVEDAEDECILLFQRTNAYQVRSLSLTRNNTLWVGGPYGTSCKFDELNVDNGTILVGSPVFTGCAAGYSGLNDCNGVLWSTGSNGFSSTWRYNTVTHTPLVPACLVVPNSYGEALDGNNVVWNTSYNTNQVFAISNNVVSGFSTVGGGLPQGTGPTGVAVTPNDNNVWTANTNTNNLTRLDGTGAHLPVGSKIQVGSSPRGVAVDTNGKVWAVSRFSNDARRIDPNCAGNGGAGCVDMTVSVGAGAIPYNYSDMTGASLLNSIGVGVWTVIQDSQIPGQVWGTITWNTLALPTGASVVVEARAANSVAGLGSQIFVPITSAVGFSLTGQFIQVRATLNSGHSAATPCDWQTPILTDLRIQCGCAITDKKILCAVDSLPTPHRVAGCYDYTFCITNNSGVIAQYALLSSTGNVTFFDPLTGAPFNVVQFSPPLGIGATSAPITVRICTSTVPVPATLPVDVILLNLQGVPCCSVSRNVTLPDCLCLQLPTLSAVCKPGSPGQYTVSFNLTNLSGGPITQMFLIPQSPAGATVNPSNIPLGTLANGATSAVKTTTISGAPPGQFCFLITIHNGVQQCCVKQVVSPGVPLCVTLPQCGSVRVGPGDFEVGGVGRLTVQDSQSFLTAWIGHDPGADVNHDGSVTVQDLFAFMTAYFAN